MHREARLLGARRQVQRAQAWLDERDRRVPERRRHLHRVHDAGFPDKFMPFMDEPPGGRFSTTSVRPYGAAVRRLRGITKGTLDKEPKWRRPGKELATGYRPSW
jgi:hypothetical protein